MSQHTRSELEEYAYSRIEHVAQVIPELRVLREDVQAMTDEELQVYVTAQRRNEDVSNTIVKHLKQWHRLL